MEHGRLELGRIQPKRIEIKVGDVYVKSINLGSTEERFEVIDLNLITKAVTIFQERYNMETILPIQNFLDLVAEKGWKKIGRMVKEKTFFIFTKKVFKQSYE